MIPSVFLGEEEIVRKKPAQRTRAEAKGPICCHCGPPTNKKAGNQALLSTWIFVFTTDFKIIFFLNQDSFMGLLLIGAYTFLYPLGPLFSSLKPQPYPIAWPKSLPSLTYLSFKIYVLMYNTVLISAV